MYHPFSPTFICGAGKWMLMATDCHDTNGAEDSERGNAFERLLTPVSKVKIIRALLDAGMPMNPANIQEQAGIGHNAWYDNFDELEELGVIDRVGEAGNSPLYVADADDELVTALTKAYDVAAMRQRGGNPDPEDSVDAPESFDE